MTNTTLRYRLLTVAVLLASGALMTACGGPSHVSQTTTTERTTTEQAPPPMVSTTTTTTRDVRP